MVESLCFSCGYKCVSTQFYGGRHYHWPQWVNSCWPSFWEKVMRSFCHKSNKCLRFLPKFTWLDFPANYPSEENVWSSDNVLKTNKLLISWHVKILKSIPWWVEKPRTNMGCLKFWIRRLFYPKRKYGTIIWVCKAAFQSGTAHLEQNGESKGAMFVKNHPELLLIEEWWFGPLWHVIKQNSLNSCQESMHTF